MAWTGQVGRKERILFLDGRHIAVAQRDTVRAWVLLALRSERESALYSAKQRVVDFEGEPAMTAREDPDRNADGLKELLRLAWSNLADPLLTSFERSEARNRTKQYGTELRRLQLIEAERLRSLKQHSTESPKGDQRSPDATD
jgi:hypothetical protein